MADGKIDFYVYIYFRPDGAPCYVGKGRGKRWGVHLRECTNRHLWAIIQQAGGDLPRVKVRQGLTNDQAAEIEIAFIAAIGREKHGGPLVNLTDGGDGMKGCNEPKSPAHRAAIGAAHKGKKRSPEHCAAISKAVTGRKCSESDCKAKSIRQTGVKRGPPSEETKRKIGLGNTGKKATDATKALMSAASKNKPKALAHRLAIGAAQVGKIVPPEVCAKLSISALARSDEISERVTNQHASMTPEEKAARSLKISIATKKAMADPANRERMLAGIKKRDEKRK